MQTETMFRSSTTTTVPEAEGDDLYFNVSYNGETYTFTVESYLCDKDTDVIQSSRGSSDRR